MSFIATSALSDRDIATVRRIVAGHPMFALYFETALDALAQGLDNRTVLIGAAGAGVVLSIEFEGMTIRTTVGSLSPAELALAAATGRRAELHIEPAHLDPIQSACAPRVRAARTLCYYRLDAPTGLAADPRCRQLGSGGLALVGAFFARHYPATVFSRWMLAQPFFGLFEDGQLLACGGVIARSDRLRAANLGNFLTRPDRRRRGLGQALVASLVAHLEAEGMRCFLLGTNADNVGACRAYEAVGFRLLGTRSQIDLSEA